ncbi:transcription factor TGA1-like [Mangifera indica]|uniref:transcription factor TGA1-like n=1 Tax=Mangifera indica TaxID=29780 RepID=UPI001CFA0E0B|nr:transcription factor TGA1-like [Mangifera indica]
MIDSVTSPSRSFTTEVNKLRQSCQQAEDALTQGMEKLQSTPAETVAAGQLVEGGCIPKIPTAMEKLEALADYFGQETLQQMSCILITRQVARGLLALGEYFQRLGAFGSIWATHPHDTA